MRFSGIQRTRSIGAFVGGAIAAAALTIATTAMRLWWIPAALIAIAVAVFVVADPARRRAGAVALAIAAVAGSTSSVLPLESASAPIVSLALRVLAVVLLATVAIGAREDADPTLPERAHRPLARDLILAVAVPCVLFVAIATIPHAQWSDAATFAIGGVILVALIVSAARIQDVRAIQHGVLWGLLAIVVGSVVVGVLLPDIGIAGERLRGLLQNANALGFMAFLLFATAWTLPMRLSLRLATSVAVVGVLATTGSRASALAVGLFVVVRMLLARPHRVIPVVAAAAVLGALLALAWPSVLEPLDLLLRTENSRASTFDLGIGTMLSHPWSGIGIDNEASEIASSHLRAAAQAGIPGLVVICAMSFAMIVVSRGSTPLLAFAIAAAAHSVFEGWLLSPIAPLLFAYVVAWVAIARTPTTVRDAISAPPVATASARMRGPG